MTKRCVGLGNPTKLLPGSDNRQWEIHSDNGASPIHGVASFYPHRRGNWSWVCGVRVGSLIELVAIAEEAIDIVWGEAITQSTPSVVYITISTVVVHDGRALLLYKVTT